MNYIGFILSLIIAILPVYMIGKYFYNKDTIKEPKKLLKKLFLSGIISGLIVIFISTIIIIFIPNIANLDNKNLLSLILYCFIFVATIEEISKFIMIYHISFNNKEFDQAFDIILYSIYVGLGFACFENIIYILSSNSSIILSFVRGITAIPAHTSFQIIMGYYLYLYKINHKKNNYILLSIIIPILLHGTYDYILLSNNHLLLLYFIIVLIFIFIFSYLKAKKLIKIDLNNLNYFCPNCNIKINYNYCPKCGYKKQ